ncbi:MAG: flagellar hook-length control protein FliK [candidate division KSB1 bacterium]|nr:flagellar hook-length control protein FliK [candidate division KSB1 bacterium]
MINQIVTRVIIMMGDERSEITMQLKPEQLGEIKIKLVVEDMGIAAKLQVENPDIKTIIESQLPELKKALAEYGLRMEKFDVLVKQEFSQRQHQAWQDTRQPKDKINRAETDRVPPVLTQVTRSLGYNTIEIIA